MKTKFTLLTILISAILFAGCDGSKDVPETREERVVRYLTGIGNKVWRLKAVYVNAIPQTLTDYQRTFTKTYTSSASNADPLNTKKGTLVNSDGFAGTWTLIGSGVQLSEKYLNNPNFPIPALYTINEIEESLLDIESQLTVAPFTLVREVYYAY